MKQFLCPHLKSSPDYKCNLVNVHNSFASHINAFKFDLVTASNTIGLASTRTSTKCSSDAGMIKGHRAALKSVGALGPDLIWAPLNTPKNFVTCIVPSTLLA